MLAQKIFIKTDTLFPKKVMDRLTSNSIKQELPMGKQKTGHKFLS